MGLFGVFLGGVLVGFFLVFLWYQNAGFCLSEKF